MRALLIFLLLSLPLRAEIPTVEFLGLDGQKRTLKELAAGKPIVLTIWCAKCRSCRKTEGAMDALARDLQGRAALVAVDASVTDTPDDIQRYLEHFKFHFPVVQDTAGGLADRFKIKQTTTTLIFDQTGALRYFGRFGDGYAARAAQEVVEGRAVSHPTTEFNGCMVVR